jgi:hypothetical protein
VQLRKCKLCALGSRANLPETFATLGVSYPPQSLGLTPPNILELSEWESRRTGCHIVTFEDIQCHMTTVPIGLSENYFQQCFQALQRNCGGYAVVRKRGKQHARTQAHTHTHTHTLIYIYIYIYMHESGYLSRYSNGLWAARPRFESRHGPRFSLRKHPNPGSYNFGTGG